MLAFLKSRGFLLTLAFVLIALFIWLAGPYFGFGEYHPLESSTARFIAIVFVALVGIAVVVFKALRANRASDKLVAAVVSQSRMEDRPSADVQQLRERFEEAVAVLKQKRRSGHSLYDLPWYVFIGAPGSGKTTALVNSGLKFPLEQRSGRGALRGIGGTRNCDWWFTEEAVFLDTAGRFTTQDSDAAADSAGWAEFLALLKKYRKRRPLNGVILTISAQDLLVETEASREAHVAAARRRLNELNKELRTQLPIYLMVTKCDLVAGFTEYFDDLSQDGRSQVWGVTFSDDETRRGDAVKAFPSEFDALMTRLNEQLFPRLEEERDPRRRAKIFGFPQQMTALRDALNDFVADVFASTRFDQQVLLRGVYFTSGTQEGTPIDRLLGAIGRRFAVAADAVMPSGRGKAYFIERLLKDVLLPESGLAGVNRIVEVQKAAAELAVWTACLVVAAVGIIVLTVSYSRNATYVSDVAAHVDALRGVPKQSAQAGLEAQLPRLDALQKIDEAANRYQTSTPWAMRSGLYQGDSLGDAARDAYTRELDSAMLPTVATRLRQRISDYAAQPETMYQYLKAYLMLGYPEHFDRSQFEALTDLEWQAAYRNDPDRVDQVTRHFHKLLAYRTKPRALTLDSMIIAQARSTLQQASQAGLVYRYIKNRAVSDSSHALRLDKTLGLMAERVLQRKSRISLSAPIASIYTRAVFQEIASKRDDVVAAFAKEYWVWGTAQPVIKQPSALSAAFMDVYEKDYIAAWDQIVADIQAVPLSSLSAMKEALDVLSGSTSPLRKFLEVVDENTYLVKPTEPAKSGFFDETLSNVKNALDAGKAKLGVAATVVPGAQVTAHFEPIHKLVAGDAGNAPIDVVLKRLKELQLKIQPLGADVGATNPSDPQSIAAVGQTANDLKRDAAPLPPSIGSVVNEVANNATSAVRGGARSSLENRYEQQVLKECRAIVSDRYPFVPGSQIDVPLADFGRLFGYGGVYDTFFKSEMQNLVDTSRGAWAWRNDSTGAPVGGSAAMLRQFEAAGRIRDAFFRSGSQLPEVQFTVTITELDQSAGRFVLELDGQSYEYRFGPLRPLPAKWPGPNPGTAAASFEERSSSARPNVAFQGPWAFFRLIDASQLQRETDTTRTRFVLSIEKGGHTGKAMIEAQSIVNPFVRRDLQQFSCNY